VPGTGPLGETQQVDQQILLAFVAGGVLIAAFHFMRLRHDTEDHRTLQEAIKAGSPIAQELFGQLRDRARRRSQTTGLVLLAIAAAIVAAGLIQGGEENLRSGGAAAVFPGFIGAVIYARSLLKRQGG
jgi:peptidoglycan/LPS O-acetylase OafA/YrhL